MNSKDPIVDVIEVLTHIIHKEIDDNSYVMTDDKNFRYFGGIFENVPNFYSIFANINIISTVRRYGSLLVAPYPPRGNIISTGRSNCKDGP